MNADTALRIKKIREYRSYTQAYMAMKLKIGQNTYSKIENGIITIKRPRLEKIAQILNVPADDILNGEIQLFNFVSKNDNNNNKDIMAEMEKITMLLRDEMCYIREQNDAIIKALGMNSNKKLKKAVNNKTAKK